MLPPKIYEVPLNILTQQNTQSIQINMIDEVVPRLSSIFSERLTTHYAITRFPFKASIH